MRHDQFVRLAVAGCQQWPARHADGPSVAVRVQPQVVAQDIAAAGRPSVVGMAVAVRAQSQAVPQGEAHGRPRRFQNASLQVACSASGSQMGWHGGPVESQALEIVVAVR